MTILKSIKKLEIENILMLFNKQSILIKCKYKKKLKTYDINFFENYNIKCKSFYSFKSTIDISADEAKTCFNAILDQKTYQCLTTYKKA